MSSQNQFGILREFDETSDEFPLYIERLEQFFKANAIKDETKSAIFLSSVGAKTYKLLRSLLQPQLPSDTTYDNLILKLSDHFTPQKNIIAERFKYYKRSQYPDEDIASYVVDLKRLASSCEFGDFLDQALRDRLVCGIRYEAIQKRLLTKKNTTFADVSDIAIAMELADKDTYYMKTPIPTVNVLKKGFSQSSTQKHYRELDDNKPNTSTNYSTPKVKCYRCGSNHYANTCKHTKSVCSKCSKVGHLSSVCRSSSAYTKNTHFSTHLLQKDADVSLENLSLYNVNTHQSLLHHYNVEVTINRHPLNMILDSGADTSTVSERWCRSILPDIHMSRSKFSLQDYNSAQVDLIGTIQVEITCDNTSRIMPITVVSGDKPALFGKDLIAIFKPDLHKLLSGQVPPIKNSFTILNNMNSDPIGPLLKTYEHLFHANRGPILGFKAEIKLKPGTKPVFKRARPVPYALKQEVEDQIRTSERSDIWTLVDQSSWATPLVLVTKKDKHLRICGDFKITVNPSTEPETYPLPTQKDLFAMLSGKKYFSKMDLKHAYQQILLSENSGQILTLNTHLGLLRPKRLLYGVNNASQIFQSIMDKLLSGLPGILCYQDDILVVTDSINEHADLLDRLFTRLTKHNVYLNPEKCSFLQERVDYLGHKIDKEGIHPDSSKIQTIHEMKPPENVSQLRTFIGMINYYTKFIPKASTLFHPLYDLLRKDNKWHWSAECQSAFDRCKAALTSDLVLVHYDHKKKITLACDASPFGVGAVLSHIMNNGDERPIAYASRTLSPPEKGYSQLEREALAIIFALKHFQQYIFGRSFTIITDHKPLISLFSPNKEIPAMAAARIQRWALLLSAFNYEIEYRKGSSHCNVDTLSRFPLRDHTSLEGKFFKVSFREELPLSHSDIRTATRSDQVLGRVMNKLRYGWENKVDEDLMPYYRRRDQLSIDEDCILWGMRVIIPSKLQHFLLDLLHESHQGMSRMKSIARSHVWWPNMDSDIEVMSRDCISCRQNQNMPPSSTLQSWIWPKRPWDRVHIDFAQKGDKSFLISVDSHSKWIDVDLMPNTTTAKTIETLRDSFSRYGLPKEIVSDNGPQFTSGEFEHFMRMNGIKHTLIPPYHPSSNGAAERSVQSFKNALKRMDSDISDSSSLKTKIARYLLAQHSTPHTTTGVTPAKLFLGRELRTRWTLLHSDISGRVESNLYKQKQCHDRSHTSSQMINTGNKVLVRNMGNDTKWLEGVVLDRQSSKTWSVLTPKGNKTYHTDQMRLDLSSNICDQMESQENEQSIETPDVFDTQDSQETAPQSSELVHSEQPFSTCQAKDIVPRRNPLRTRKPPDKMNL